MNEEEPFVDRVVASGSLKKGLQSRATPQRWHRDVQRLIDLVAFLCFFDNRKHVFLSTVASLSYCLQDHLAPALSEITPGSAAEHVIFRIATWSRV